MVELTQDLEIQSDLVCIIWMMEVRKEKLLKKFTLQARIQLLHKQTSTTVKVAFNKKT
jgi:hypothetical protein